jgi:hypothetical protein
VKRTYPGFAFLAEAYWDLEWELLSQGFDHAYDKRLYDRLRWGDAAGVRAHLGADLSFQARLARFIENHDEERAAVAFGARHRAAALIAYLAPGLKFFHEGQLDGRRARLPVQLCRAPEESSDAGLAGFYEGLLRLLSSPVLRGGAWRLRERGPEAIVAFEWASRKERLIVVVNYGDGPTRHAVRDLSGWVRLLDPDGWRADQRTASTTVELDLPGWGARVIEAATAS